jgi:hypothetical protein
VNAVQGGGALIGGSLDERVEALVKDKTRDTISLRPTHTRIMKQVPPQPFHAVLQCCAAMAHRDVVAAFCLVAFKNIIEVHVASESASEAQSRTRMLALRPGRSWPSASTAFAGVKIEKDPPPSEDGPREQEGMGGHGRVEPAVGGGCGTNGEEGEDGARVGWGGIACTGLLR